MKITELTYYQALKKMRLLTPSGSRKLKVAVGGNANFDFMIPGLICGLSEMEYDSACVSLDYDSWTQAVYSNKETFDFWIIWLSSQGATFGGTQRQDFDFRAIADCASILAERGQQLIIIQPEPMRSEEDAFSANTRWRNELALKLSKTVPETAIITSVDHIQRKIGLSDWHSGKYWDLAKSPAHPDAMTTTGVFLSKLISQLLRPKIKAIITDLDNTLWDGVVGDDGPENLGLDVSGSGRAFVEMQLFLKDQTNKGTPLSVCSKNSPEQALRPFQERPEMLLKQSDFIYFEASWSPKYLAIKSIAERLNLGLDDICFIDDSQHEREEARTMLPDLQVPELPTNPDERVLYLIETGWFMHPRVLSEDKERVSTYHQNALRQNAEQQATSLEQYLVNLKIELNPEPISAKNLKRVEQLIQKTNQFNLTALRQTASEINEYISRPDSYAYVFSVSDRFGKSGIISAVLASRCGSKMLINSWVMSCRVFSRKIEHAILEHMLLWAKDAEITTIELPFVPTKKNNLVKEFLLEVGFDFVESGNSLVFEGETNQKLSHHAKIIRMKERSESAKNGVKEVNRNF